MVVKGLIKHSPDEHQNHSSSLGKRPEAEQLHTRRAKTRWCCLGRQVLTQSSVEREAGVLQAPGQHRCLVKDEGDITAPRALDRGQSQQVFFELGVFFFNINKKTSRDKP